MRRYEANLRSEANSISRGAANDERVRALAEEKNEVVLDGWLESGDVAEVEKWMAEPANAGILDSKSRRWYRTRIKEGGGLGQSVTNPNTYIALAAMTSMDIDDLRLTGYEAEAGDGSPEDNPTGAPLGREEMLSSRINAAYRDNRLSRTDRDQLLKARDEHRFGGAQKHLEDSLRAGLLSGNAGPPSRIKAGEALAEFIDWRTDPANRKASRADAMSIARMLVRDGSFVNYQDLEQVKLNVSPLLKRDPVTKRIDKKASATAILAARNDGRLTETEYAYEMHNLTRSLEQEPPTE